MSVLSVQYRQRQSQSQADVPKDVSPMIFNDRLRQLRKEHKLTQVELAQELGLAYRNYQRLEADGNTPHYQTLARIADYFDVSVDWLMGRTDRPQVYR